MFRIILFILVNGLLGAVQSLAASHGVILQYHHVAEHTPAATTLNPDAFRRQMAFLHEHGFTVWPLSKLVEALAADQPVPDGLVAITFDDAYDDIAKVAAPILQQYRFPFTVFVSTAFVDQRQRGYMTWDDLRRLQKQGVELANHTHTHPHLIRHLEGESEAQWLARIRQEIETAQARLSAEAGVHNRYLAYPYGEMDAAVIELIKSLGYVGFGQQSGAVDKHALQSGMAPRFPFNNYYADITDFQHKASSVPLPIAALEASPQLWLSAGKPVLTLQLPDSISSLRCFASGQGAIGVTHLPENRFEITANKSIAVGRSRYNCTAPLPKDGARFTLPLQPRFYWYSHQWLRKQDDGSWYPEP